MSAAGAAALIALSAAAQPSIPEPEAGEVSASIPEFYSAACVASNWIFAFVLILGVIFILFGAFQFMASRGDEERVATARRSVTFTLVGISVAVLAKSLIYVVGNFLGADPTSFFEC